MPYHAKHHASEESSAGANERSLVTMPHTPRRASERVAYDSDAANSERIKVTTKSNDSYTKTEHNHQQIVETCRHVQAPWKITGAMIKLLPNRGWNQKQKHKKQPWNKVECFAFGGATVRFASLETSFHAANHTIPPPPSYEGYPKDKNRSPFHGEKPLMVK